MTTTAAALRRACVPLAIAIGLTSAAGAGAATIPVTCADGPAGLTTAVNTANSTPADDTIDITDGPCTFTYASPDGPGAAGAGDDSALPIVTQPLTIVGRGSTIARSGVAGTVNFRLINVQAASLTLQNLSLSSGKLSGGNNGAGLAALNSTVSLEQVHVSGNGAAGGSGGGAYFQGGTVTVDHSSFQVNSAASGGGFASVGATTTVLRSEVRINTATTRAGAALVQGGAATLENDTIATNGATGGTGGVGVLNNAGAQGTATITNVTFADNSTSPAANVAPGGAVFTCLATCGGSGTAPTVHVRNTIVTDTDSTAAATSPPCDQSLGGTIVFDGGNLEYPTSTCTGAHANPQLAAVSGANGNGGPTFNYRLLPTSPAIDLGVGTCPATDQRDTTRPGGDACDAGAYETHPPQTSATGPASPTNNPQVTFSADRAGSTFQCKVDSGTFSPCTTGFTPSVSDGTHTVAVRASVADSSSSSTVSNTYTDPSPAVVTFTVDKTKPAVTIPPQAWSSPTSDATPTISFSATDPNLSTVQCTVDTGTAVPCGSSFTASSLIDGQHTITVTATDAAGNTNSAAITFTVDTTAPVVTIASPSWSSPTNDATPTIGFTATDPNLTTVRCSVDAGTPVPCGSSFTAPSLGDGQHTITVTANDAAQNSGSDAITFTVDTVGPAAPPIAGGPSGLTKAQSPTFTFSAPEAGAGLVCRFDADAFSACGGGSFTPSSPLSDGTHVFEVRAVDAAGNTGQTAQRGFTVDATAPAAPSVTGGPGAATSDAQPTFTFSGEPGATLACRFDGAAFSPCDAGSATPPSALDVGDHAFEVKQTDAAGNESPVTRRPFAVTAPPPPPDGGGDAGPDPSPPPRPGGGDRPADHTAPVISAAAITPRSFSPKTGATLRLTLSEVAKLAIEVDLVSGGRLSGKRCVKPTAKLSRAKTCPLLTKITTIQPPGAKGVNTIALKGKVGSKTLRPGAYQAVLLATDAAGNRSRTVKVSFTVKR